AATGRTRGSPRICDEGDAGGGPDPGQRHPLPGVRPWVGRADADRRLPVLLRLQGLRRAPQAAAGRLLRVLLVRDREMPADAGGQGRLLNPKGRAYRTTTVVPEPTRE